MSHNFLDRVLTSIMLLRYRKKLNLWSTFFFNFRAFPLKIALKFPVYVYGSATLIRVGTIIIKDEHIYKGMIHLGEDFFKATQKTIFNNWGTITIGSGVRIRAGVNLFNRGRICINSGTRIGENVYISISKELKIGEKTSIGYCSSIVDSDDHYIVNINTGEVKRNDKAIVIGHNCWLGSQTYVKKGVVLPNYIIVASSNCLLVKDYTSTFSEYSIVGGNPVRILKNGYLRIMDMTVENSIRTFFENDKSLSFSFKNTIVK